MEQIPKLHSGLKPDRIKVEPTAIDKNKVDVYIKQYNNRKYYVSYRNEKFKNEILCNKYITIKEMTDLIFKGAKLYIEKYESKDDLLNHCINIAIYQFLKKLNAKDQSAIYSEIFKILKKYK